MVSTAICGTTLLDCRRHGTMPSDNSCSRLFLSPTSLRDSDRRDRPFRIARFAARILRSRVFPHRRELQLADQRYLLPAIGNAAVGAQNNQTIRSQFTYTPSAAFSITWQLIGRWLGRFIGSKRTRSNDAAPSNYNCSAATQTRSPRYTARQLTSRHIFSTSLQAIRRRCAKNSRRKEHYPYK